MLQSLAGCEYFPYVFSEFDGKLVIGLTTCEDNKVVTVSSMHKENKLTSADWNVICFSLASAIKYMHLKVAATDIQYFARSKLSRSLVYKKNFSLLWQLIFQLGYLFCQKR